MASSLRFASSSLLLLIAAVSLLVSPAISQTCKSQTFGTQSNATFANCVDLPALGAFLHYTYDSSAAPNPTLTLAFIAPPASPDGWVAWALNPTAPAMAGAQALVAFREANGSAVVKTYNITSYSSIAESPIAYEVLSRRAEFSGGVMTIFATLELPSGVAELNQVWQVGASVRNGVPAVHAFGPENLSSTGTLRLGSTAAPPTGSTGNGALAPTGSGVNAPPPPPTRESGNDTAGSSMIYGGGFRLYGILVLLGLFFSL